uniref:ParB-like N-terminal domain-containing protein n=1 Tax=Thermodesulfobacterium geofontis TaxID=1295609 RepID=A0A7V4N344_9BACT
MPLKYTIVSIENIDLQDRTYLFSYPKRGEFLKNSIKSVGLLQPPILFLEKGYPKFKIVCGEGRIIACKELGIQEIPAFIGENYSSKELFLLSLESNLFRTLNIVEKAEVVGKALNFFSIEEVINLLPKLSLNPSYYWIEYLQAIYSLEDPIKTLIVEERLNPKVAVELADLSSKEKEEYLEFLKKLNLSFSEQKEVLEKLLDYKKRKDLPSLLPEKLKEALKEEDFNKRKIEFFRILKELYYSFYFHKWKKVSSLIEKFRKKDIYLSFSPYFEKKEIEIQFKNISFEDFQKKLEFIEKNKEEIKKIWEDL